jgi:hypothetical protein
MKGMREIRKLKEMQIAITEFMNNEMCEMCTDHLLEIKRKVMER